MPKNTEIETPTNGSAAVPTAESTPFPDTAVAAQSSVQAEKTVPPWHTFVATAKNAQVKERFANDIKNLITDFEMEKYCVLALLEPLDSIDSNDLDRVFQALCELNPDKARDVLLLLLSGGGSIEPAYQISKLCKSFAKDRFLAVVPRHAKSAATLAAIGADEIHMGPLGQLGPIDPQLEGLPALGVSQALQTIASVAQQFPGSAEMFAKYLRMALTVEQIGYCDRISESAVQYAQRLLSTKPKLQKIAESVAKELVHEYKDHGFVIDVEEAKMHLGADWVMTGTPELAFAEAVYTHFEMVNFFLRIAKSKRLLVTGGVTLPESVLVLSTKERD